MNVKNQFRLTDKCLKGRTDCFGYGIGGVCKVVTDTRFNGPCPFFKTTKQRAEEHAQTLDKLEREGKGHLISKYGVDNEHYKVWREI